MVLGLSVTSSVVTPSRSRVSSNVTLSSVWRSTDGLQVTMFIPDFTLLSWNLRLTRKFPTHAVMLLLWGVGFLLLDQCMVLVEDSSSDSSCYFCILLDQSHLMSKHHIKFLAWAERSRNYGRSVNLQKKSIPLYFVLISGWLGMHIV